MQKKYLFHTKTVLIYSTTYFRCSLLYSEKIRAQQQQHFDHEQCLNMFSDVHACIISIKEMLCFHMIFFQIRWIGNGITIFKATAGSS